MTQRAGCANGQLDDPSAATVSAARRRSSSTSGRRPNSNGSNDTDDLPISIVIPPRGAAEVRHSTANDPAAAASSSGAPAASRQATVTTRDAADCSSCAAAPTAPASTRTTSNGSRAASGADTAPTVRGRNGKASRESVRARVAPMPVAHRGANAFAYRVLRRPRHLRRDQVRADRLSGPGRTPELGGRRDVADGSRHARTGPTVQLRGCGDRRVRRSQLIGAPPGLPAVQSRRQYRDLAALRGDPADELDGVDGFGDKRAASLLEEFGTVSAAYAAGRAAVAESSAHASRSRCSPRARPSNATGC